MSSADSKASLEPGSKIPKSCLIGPNARLVGKVRLGDSVKVSANTIIWGPITIGNATYLGPNCIVGHPAKHDFKESLSKGNLDLTGHEGTATKIGRNVIIRSNSIIYSSVTISDNVSSGHNILLREETRIGEGSTIGSNVTIDGRCSIGRGVSIQTGVYIPPYSKIGDLVFLGPHCILLNDKYLSRKKTELVGPTIRRGASIGGGAVLLPGVVVGEGAVVAAGAVVTENVKARTVVAGVPARFLKPLPEDWSSPL